MFMRQTKSKTLTNIGKPWTQVDINRLSRMYPDTPDRIIGENLCRTQTAIHTRAAMLGLKKNYPAGAKRLRIRKLWTKKEICLLIKLYPNMTADEIAEKLNRSSSTIVCKANMLGLKKTLFWSREQIDFVKKFYRTTTYAQLAGKLGRTRDSVTAMIHRLNLGGKKAPRWTNKEIKLLRGLHSTTKIKEIAEKLGRSPDSVRLRARQLGLKRKPFWSKKQINYVKKFYRTTTYAQIARKLGKARGSISSLIQTLKLDKKGRAISWTEEEKKFLRENFPNHTNKWLADKLKKPIHKIAAFGFKNRIGKSPELIYKVHSINRSGQTIDF